jgi:hypothetical protein
MEKKDRAIQVHPFSETPEARQKQKMEEQVRNEKLFEEILKDDEGISSQINNDMKITNSMDSSNQNSALSLSPTNSTQTNK